MNPAEIKPWSHTFWQKRLNIFISTSWSFRLSQCQSGVRRQDGSGRVGDAASGFCFLVNVNQNCVNHRVWTLRGRRPTSPRRKKHHIDLHWTKDFKVFLRNVWHPEAVFINPGPIILQRCGADRAAHWSYQRLSKCGGTTSEADARKRRDDLSLIKTESWDDDFICWLFLSLHVSVTWPHICLWGSNVSKSLIFVLLFL